MAEQSQRLSKVAKEFNVGVDTILDFLASKGVDNLNRNSKISSETYDALVDEYQPDKKVKAEAKELKKAEAEQKSQEKENQTLRVKAPKIEGLKIVSKVDIVESKSTNEQEKLKIKNKDLSEALKLCENNNDKTIKYVATIFMLKKGLQNYWVMGYL